MSYVQNSRSSGTEHWLFLADILLTLLAYFSALSDSSRLDDAGLMQHIINVFALPPNESYNKEIRQKNCSF